MIIGIEVNPLFSQKALNLKVAKENLNVFSFKVAPQPKNSRRQANLFAALEN